MTHGNYNPEISLDAPQPSGLQITEQHKGIINIIENEGFIYELRLYLLGRVYDRKNRSEMPKQLRRLDDNSVERVDYVKEELILECNNCGLVNNVILTCPSCAKPLNELKCKEHGLINKPSFRCGHCFTDSEKVGRQTVNYINDSALMNEQGVNKIISLIKILSSPVSLIGSTKEWFKLLNERNITYELQVCLDNNQENFGIGEENLEVVKATLVNYLDSLFNLVTSDRPESVLERLTKMFSEVKQTIQSDKKGGKVP